MLPLRSSNSESNCEDLYEDCSRRSGLPLIIFPRVFPNQREKFKNDPIFEPMLNECAVTYPKFQDLSMRQRLIHFQNEISQGELELSFLTNGQTIYLTFTNNPKGNCKGSFEYDPREDVVYLHDTFIMHGVHVLFSGLIDLHTLDGCGKLELDEEEVQRCEREKQYHHNTTNQQTAESTEDKSTQHQKNPTD